MEDEKLITAMMKEKVYAERQAAKKGKLQRGKRKHELDGGGHQHQRRGGGGGRAAEDFAGEVAVVQARIVRNL